MKEELHYTEVKTIPQAIEWYRQFLERELAYRKSLLDQSKTEDEKKWYQAQVRVVKNCQANFLLFDTLEPEQTENKDKIPYEAMNRETIETLEFISDPENWKIFLNEMMGKEGISAGSVYYLSVLGNVMNIIRGIIHLSQKSR